HALLGRAPAHVTARHVDDSGSVTEGFHLEQEAAGSDLGVVGMRSEREDVDGHGRQSIRGLGTRASAGASGAAWIPRSVGEQSLWSPVFSTPRMTICPRPRRIA